MTQSFRQVGDFLLLKTWLRVDEKKKSDGILSLVWIHDIWFDSALFRDPAARLCWLLDNVHFMRDSAVNNVVTMTTTIASNLCSSVKLRSVDNLQVE